MTSEGSTPTQGSRPRRRWVVRVALGGAVLAALSVPVAWASDRFVDVSNTNPHHDDINTVARAGITGGCSPTLYCPGDAVTRQQMGSFLARTLRSLTPVVTTGQATGNPLDPDLEPIVCQTGDFTPSVEARVFVRGWVGLTQNGAGQLGWFLGLVRSTDSGASWALTNFNHRATSVTAGAAANAFDMHQELRTAGTPVRYGLQVLRESGTADADSAACEIEAVFTYADAGASALG